MSRMLNNIVIFVAGAAIGSLATWKFVEEKYKRIAQEEIDSYKEYCSEKEPKEEPVEEIETPEPETTSLPNMRDYAKELRDAEYVNYSNGGMNELDKPYVISPDEFGELFGYDTISLTYYLDNVLTDDADEIIDEVDKIVGYDSLNHFGEYEDDSVFVRNDRLKCDYEILLDQRNYADVMKDRSHPTGDR